jgi:transposase
LEGRFELVLANATHVKNVAGRKTDVKDSEWIAQLLQHGLLKPSFVPDSVLRDLRELSRDRTSWVAERSRLKNRIQKILEDANIKLGSVASDILGKSGRAMLTAMVKGITTETRPLGNEGRVSDLRPRFMSLAGIVSTITPR